MSILLVWLIFASSVFGRSATDILSAAYNNDIFESINHTVPEQRVELARATYRINCRRMPEKEVMQKLDNLKQMAINLKDLPLECATFDMRADYYSVNHGYNTLSTKYYDQAITFAKANDLIFEKGIYEHRKANYYFLYKQNTAACRYYLLSEETFKEIGFNNVPGIGNLFSETASFYYSMGDFENARQNLLNALKYETTVSRIRINIANTLGLTYRNDGQYKTAMGYFNSALYMAKSIKDTAWVAIATGNIGSVYFLQKQYDKALPLIRLDYAQSLKYEEHLNSAIALLRLIRINLDQSNLKHAVLQLDTADKILSTVTVDAIKQRAEYYELKATVNERLRNINKAIMYRAISEKLRDSLYKRDNIIAIERVRLQWVTEKSHEEFNSLKKAAKVTAYKQNTIIVVLGLLLIIIFLIYNRQRLKAKKDKDLLESEKLRIDEELKFATQALHGYTENLMQKNILIDNIKLELENAKVKLNNTTAITNLDKMMQAHIMTDESWAEFKSLFLRVHNTFFYNLRNNYNNLSDTDIRLISLIKLKLNNREMAGMLGITVDGIKKAKQRLRKKMDILADEDIEDIINRI